MNAKKFFRMSVFSRYLIIAAGAFTANYAVAGLECNCDHGIDEKGFDVNTLVVPSSYPGKMLDSKEWLDKKAGFAGTRDANGYTLPVFHYMDPVTGKRLSFVRLVYEIKTDSFGLLGGSSDGAKETLRGNIKRESEEETALGEMYSDEALDRSVLLATVNHRVTPEFVSVLEVNQPIPSDYARDAYARMAQSNNNGADCAKVKKNPEKRCPFLAVKAEQGIWVAVADLFGQSYNTMDPTVVFPVIKDGEGNMRTLNPGENPEMEVRVLENTPAGLVVVMKKYKFGRDKLLSIFRNVWHTPANKSLADKEDKNLVAELTTAGALAADYLKWLAAAE